MNSDERMIWVPFGGISINGIDAEEIIYRSRKDKENQDTVLHLLTITNNGKIGTPNQVLAYELYKNNQYSIFAIGKSTLDNKLPVDDMYITIIRNTDSIKGVNYLKFDVAFPEGVEIVDYGPKTEWIQNPNKNIEISNEQPITIPYINIPIPIKFKFVWNKKVGRVISGRYGNGVYFEFNKVDEYLDGERSLYFAVRVPKDKALDKITINNIKIRYDKSWIKDKEEQIDKIIEIQVQTYSL